jgi:hypothetical protein
VSLPFIKPEDANHWMSIQGVVIEIIDEDDHVHGATVTASLNDTSQAYLGEGTYPMRDPAGGEVRCRYRIQPNRVQVFGSAPEIGDDPRRESL